MSDKLYVWCLILHLNAGVFFLIIATKRTWLDFGGSCIDFRLNIAVIDFPQDSDTSENKLFGTH